MMAEELIRADQLDVEAFGQMSHRALIHLGGENGFRPERERQCGYSTGLQIPRLSSSLIPRKHFSTSSSCTIANHALSTTECSI
jgi:hypothetical protein